MRGHNPAIGALGKHVYDGVGERATHQGVAVKAMYFVMLAIFAAVLSSILLYKMDAGTLTILLIVSVIVALVAGLVAAFAPATVKITGTVYALAEGFVIGVVSAMLEAFYSGIVLAALMSTFGVFAVMMVLYISGVIKVSQKFKSFMYSALIAIVLINIIVFIVSLFSATVANLFYGNGIFSILASVVMVLLASFFILVDLSNIDEIVMHGLDKKYEWTAAFSLVLTLIWLYLEFLRLFSKIASRRR